MGTLIEEHPAPRRVHQHTAQRRTGRGREAPDRRPDAHRAHPAGRRGRGRAADPDWSGSAGRRRLPAAPGRPPAARAMPLAAQPALASGEHRHPEQEAALAPVPVGQPAEGHQQRGVDDRVAVEDPAQVGEAGAAAGPRPMSGSATLTMNRSRLAMNAASDSTTRTATGRRGPLRQRSVRRGTAGSTRHSQHYSSWLCLGKSARLNHEPWTPASSLEGRLADRDALERRRPLLDRPRDGGRRHALGDAAHAGGVLRHPPLRRLRRRGSASPRPSRPSGCANWSTPACSSARRTRSPASAPGTSTCSPRWAATSSRPPSP